MKLKYQLNSHINVYVDEAGIFSTDATISFENRKVIITDKENRKEYKYND